MRGGSVGADRQRADEGGRHGRSRESSCSGPAAHPVLDAPRTPITDGPDVLPALPGDLYGDEQMLPSQFPHHLIPSLGDLGVIGPGYDRPGRPATSRLLTDVGRSRWRCAFVAQRRR